jgi:5-methylcytosine-specific restriction endonuclease McrA
MAKEGNPRWKDGASASRVQPHVTRRFRELRPLVMKRDGQRCVLCEATDRLEVHHIDENPLNNRTANLVTLCRPCHETVHFSAEKETLSARLKTHAETPLSTTYRWKKQSASSRTGS